jgi:glutaredoxin
LQALTPEKIQVVIYSKPGCHLCEEMKQEMTSAGCSELYSLKEINIEGDPELLKRYQNDIPVLLIEGVEAFRHRLKAEDFRARILAANRSGTSIMASPKS